MSARFRMDFDLFDLAATLDLAARMAILLEAGDVLLLEGPLGAGKTEFARGLIRHLCGADEAVPSPSFTLVQTYQPPSGPLIWHFDLYRLSGPDEVMELGWDEARTGIALVEWPQRLGGMTPARSLHLSLLPIPGAADRRLATLTGPLALEDRFLDPLSK